MSAYRFEGKSVKTLRHLTRGTVNSYGQMCLKLEWNHTHVEKQNGNSLEKFITYSSSNRNRTYAFAMPGVMWVLNVHLSEEVDIK